MYFLVFLDYEVLKLGLVCMFSFFRFCKTGDNELFMFIDCLWL